MNTRALEAWFKKAHRQMPWRKTRDPYAIWISEVMLQQTQVATVIPYYERFMAKLPDVRRLAKAKEDTVLSLWSGLGYYSRARNLQKGAKYLIENFKGEFPRDRETLLETPGIGPYTAGAILSIAFGLKVPIVDGNVQRVFARYYAWKPAIETKASQNFFWEKASEWVAGSNDPRVLNQAIMELGATVCIKGKPRCEVCPLSKSCLAYRKGIQEKLPTRKPKREKIDLYWLAIRYRHKDKLWLERVPKGEWWEDLWDLPREVYGEQGVLNDQAQKLLDAFEEKARRLGQKKHAVTHHRLHVTGIEVKLDRPEALDPAEGQAVREGRWFPVSKVLDLPLSSLARKVLMLE